MSVRLAAAVGLALALAGCGGGALSKHALEKDAESIQSLAAEGSLVAGDAADGSTTSVFTRVHVKYLADAGEKLGKTLAGAKAAGKLEQERSDAAALADRVTSALRRLHASPSNRPLAKRIESELAQLAAAAKRVSQ